MVSLPTPFDPASFQQRFLNPNQPNQAYVDPSARLNM